MSECVFCFACDHVVDIEHFEISDLLKADTRAIWGRSSRYEFEFPKQVHLIDYS